MKQSKHTQYLGWLRLGLGICCLAFVQNGIAQNKENYKVACVGFYNVENLYDTLDQPNVDDAEFLANGTKAYTAAIYEEKQRNMASIISKFGTELTPDGIAIMGLAEVENANVIQDLVNMPELKSRNYQVVHYDSPDLRGVDVGLIYQPKYFKVLGSRPVNLPIKNDDGTPRLTRDILFVSGIMDNDVIHILVNHWPSRRGGEKASQPYRNAAALVCKNIVDSLYKSDPNSKVIIMGDLNDDPVSPSVAKVLGAKGKKEKVGKMGIFNPMYSFYKQGTGTLGYNDAWNIFDQLMITYPFLDENSTGYHYYKTQIYNEPKMIEDQGQYKGYPKRSFSGDTWNHGYSDHFPVYLFLVKAI